MHLSLVHAAQEAPNKHKDIWAAASGSFVHFTANPATEWTSPEQRIKIELSKLGVLCTPEGFFSAAETGNRAAIALFIEANSNTEILDNRGWTLLMTAAFNGHKEIVWLLTGHGADVNDKVHCFRSARRREGDPCSSQNARQKPRALHDDLLSAAAIHPTFHNSDEHRYGI